MKKCLLLFLMLPVLSLAQRDKKLEDYILLKADSGSMRVKLPELSYLDWKKVNTEEKAVGESFVINADSVYYKLFSRFHKDSLPSFDFAKKQLYSQSYCIYCVTACPRINGAVEPCHRNACSYTIVWYMRNKK